MFYNTSLSTSVVISSIVTNIIGQVTLFNSMPSQIMSYKIG